MLSVLVSDRGRAGKPMKVRGSALLQKWDSYGKTTCRHLRYQTNHCVLELVKCGSYTNINSASCTLLIEIVFKLINYDCTVLSARPAE